MNPLAEYWYFHLPNFLLAALMYTLIGRLILGFFVSPDWKNYIWRFFVNVTGPALRLTRLVTPALVPPTVVTVFAILWIMLLRVALFIGLANLNLLPEIPG